MTILNQGLVLKICNYLVNEESTLRKTAAHFKISYGTVFRASLMVKKYDKELDKKVQARLLENYEMYQRTNPKKIRKKRPKILSQLEVIERRLDICEYIIENKCTLIIAGEHFNISHETVRKEVQRIESIDPVLYCEVRKVFKKNLKERSIRASESNKKRKSLREYNKTNIGKEGY